MSANRKAKFHKKRREEVALQKSLAHLPVQQKMAPGQEKEKHKTMHITTIGIRRKLKHKIKWLIQGKSHVIPTKNELKIDQNYDITIVKEVKLRSGKNKGEMVPQDVINNKPGKRYRPRTEQVIAKGDVVPK